MNSEEYKKLVGLLKVGKKLPDAIYLHKSAIVVIPHDLYTYLLRTIEKKGLAKTPWNIVKFFKNNFKFSLLHYPSFLEDPYPSLHSSNTIDLGKGTVRSSNFQKSENPPILHRKELFVLPSHPNFEKYKKITFEGEQAGLYENPRKIGFKKSWHKVIKGKNYKLENNKLVKIG